MQLCFSADQSGDKAYDEVEAVEAGNKAADIPDPVSDQKDRKYGETVLFDTAKSCEERNDPDDREDHVDHHADHSFIAGISGIDGNEPGSGQ